MSLPPLPKELAAFAETQARHCALNDMVQAYGQQCRAEALEEAAKACDAAKPHPDQYSPLSEYTEKRVCLELAEKIRSLKS